MDIEASREGMVHLKRSDMPSDITEVISWIGVDRLSKIESLQRRRRDMKRLVALLSLALLCACSTAKYEVNPDGSKPVLYPAAEVLKWPLVDGAHQSPSGSARIYIDPSVQFESGVQLGDGVRIASGSFIQEDVILFPNVTVGQNTRIEGDNIIQGGVKIGNKVLMRGDSVIGAGSVIEDGATIGKQARVGKRVTIGAGSKVGPGSVIGDGATVPKSKLLPPQTRIDAVK